MEVIVKWIIIKYMETKGSILTPAVIGLLIDDRDKESVGPSR